MKRFISMLLLGALLIVTLMGSSVLANSKPDNYRDPGRNEDHTWGGDPDEIGDPAFDQAGGDSFLSQRYFDLNFLLGTLFMEWLTGHEALTTEKHHLSLPVLHQQTTDNQSETNNKGNLR